MAEALSCLDGCLLPRTLLRAVPDGAPPDTRDLQTSALEALGSSKEVLEQARCVLSSSDAMSMGSKNDGVIFENNTGHLQERRQGLGRKRARFSMKPVTSMESVNIHMKLDIDNLADPEEYFSAIEKFEIADKELKKLRGQDSSDLLEHHQVAAVRKRRPGILGKTASYRHTFGADLDRLEDHLSAMEVCKRVTSGQPEVAIDFGYKDPVKDNSCNAPQEREATQNTFSCATEGEGPITEKENRVGNLLDTLLSSFETLDDDDGTALLQEQLQLKKINLDKIRLPVTPAIKKRLTVKERVQKSNMVALTQRSTVHTRSPLSPISLLRKQSLQMDLLNDPYSSSPCPTKDINSRESSWKKSVDNTMDKLSLPRQDDTTVQNLDSATFHSVHDVAMVDLSDKEANANRLPSDKEAIQSSPPKINSFLDMLEDSPSAQSNFALENLPSGTLDKNEKQDAASPSEGSRHLTDICGLVDGSAKMRDIDSSMREDLVDQESRLEDSDVLHECSTSAVVTTPLANGDFGTSGAKPVESDKPELPLSRDQDFCKEQPGPETLKGMGGRDLNDSSEYAAHCTEPCGNAGACESEKENLENGMVRTEEASRETEVQYLKDHQGHAATSVVTYPLANGDSGISGNLTAENSQELHRNSPVPLEGNPKAKAHHRRPKRQSFNKRQSLAETGTKWEAGLRRSTRNRVRPLEFWRGEKLLYGRIHNSLATVIGIKYSSPGNANLKVKSYVPNEYAELLERVSLH